MPTVSRTVQLNERAWPYILRRRKGHGKITLKVHASGLVTVITNTGTPIYMIERFLAEKRTWLIQVLSGLPVWSSAPSYQIRGDYKKHKEQARTLVHRELERINIHYGFVYGRVSIRNTTSRWGSCSSKKNLNFSYRVFFLPPHLREYVLVHELCHLKEMNHGPAFWALVAQTVPNYRECRREVRKEVLA